MKQIKVIYYSPTGTSAKVAESVASACSRALGGLDVTIADLTIGENQLSLENGFAIIAAPVYGGRIAPTAIERIRKIKAKNIFCALIAVYGNRDYEDALLELVNESRNCGFVPVAAAAFIGEHSYSTEEYPIAQDRPDSDDLQKCTLFGEEMAAFVKKMKESISINNIPLLKVKGNFPYKEYKPSPATPQTDRSICVLCGRCIDMCPVGCIEMKPVGKQEEQLEEEIVSDPMVCTKCCACVKGCPFGARIFNTPYSEMLHKNFSARKEPEWYFAV